MNRSGPGSFGDGEGDWGQTDGSQNFPEENYGHQEYDYDQYQEYPPAEEEGPGGGEKPSFWRWMGETALIIIAAIIFAVLLQSFVVKTFVITSTSMSPTLQEGDRVMVDKMTYLFRDPRRGDIILFRYPPDTPRAKSTSNIFYWPFERIGEVLWMAHKDTTPYVKRVVATAGETVELKKGNLYIEGEEIEEDYINDNVSDFGPYKVPEGTVFCMGDNRQNSRDSRAWGPVPKNSVIGRLFLIWWPPSHWGRP
ncbi:MAG: signal peptidase I [Actinobacteria bacterium]|nr:signal peptidase I [Actinomycetota bacterium]